MSHSEYRHLGPLRLAAMAQELWICFFCLWIFVFFNSTFKSHHPPRLPTIRTDWLDILWRKEWMELTDAWEELGQIQILLSACSLITFVRRAHFYSLVLNTSQLNFFSSYHCHLCNLPKPTWTSFHFVLSHPSLFRVPVPFVAPK